MTKWTDREGRANSSLLFQQARAEVASLIHDNAYSLLHGKALDVAGLIVAQIAHSDQKPWPEVRAAIHAEWQGEDRGGR